VVGFAWFVSVVFLRPVTLRFDLQFVQEQCLPTLSVVFAASRMPPPGPTLAVLSYVGGLKRQTENPTIDRLDRLAATLGVPLWAFFMQPARGAPVAKTLPKAGKSRIQSVRSHKIAHNSPEHFCDRAGSIRATRLLRICSTSIATGASLSPSKRRAVWIAIPSNQRSRASSAKSAQG
jgi:hypothetical protein